jgi:hypothetical protein
MVNAMIDEMVRVAARAPSEYHRADDVPWNEY